jgi:ferredoxin
MFGKKRKMTIDEDKCIGCGFCEAMCAHDAIEITGGKARIIDAKCDGIGACIRECPQGAIRFADQPSKKA